MSEKFLGGGPVFWSALQAIGTVIAFFLGFLFMLRKDLSNWILSKSLKVKNLKVNYSILEKGTIISWELHNTPFLWFGQDIFGLHIQYWIHSDKLNETTYDDKRDNKIFIPKNTVNPQSVISQLKITEGYFSVKLVFKSDGRVVGRYTKKRKIGG